MPDGLLQANGEYYYAEYPPGSGVRTLGLADFGSDATPEEQRAREEVKNELF